jgi:hypothetical protein
MSDPLTRANIEIFGDQDPSEPAILLAGLPGEQTAELPPGGTLALPPGQQPVVKPIIFKPDPMKTPIRAGLAASFAEGLTTGELEGVPAGEPLVIAVYGRTLDLAPLSTVARQATDGGHSLIILARSGEDS